MRFLLFDSKSPTLMTLLTVVILLGILALISAHLSRSAEDHHPAKGSIITIDDLSLHYLESGDPTAKDTLVLLHGASTSLLDFEPSLRPLLENNYRVIAFDRPGHGYSDRAAGNWPDPASQANTVNKALEQLGVESAHWVGHSWAGSVVLAAALNHPGKVESATLMAGASHAWEGGVAWHATLANVPFLGRVFSYTLAAPAGQLVLHDAIASVFKPEQVPEDYVSQTGVRLSLRPHSFRNNATDLARLSNWLQTQERRYTELTVPLLLLTGDKDTVVPDWNHAERLAKLVPGAQWHRLKGAGHALHHTRSNKVAELVDRFIRDQYNKHQPE